ncbi:HNH endonuclease [Streptomyces sp. 2A115]|uniref:HNH endonuclease n=1 Tax=Streptomyces sp. 2A115 TaxID=3457439 RepID=UPI003FD0AF58
MDRQVANPRSRKELITRLLKGKCELCGTSENVRVHHIRKLADLDQGKLPTDWHKVMMKKRRKTLVVCTACHDIIHSGKPTNSVTK